MTDPLTITCEDWPVLQPHRVPPRGTSITAYSAPPLPPADGRRSPLKFPSQSTNSPYSSRSPSPNVSTSQDSAFPLFPTSKSRSTTPTTPSEINQSFASYRIDYQTLRDSRSSFAPISPRDNGGGSILQRMDSIAPGPFHLSSKDSARPGAHKRTATMGSSKDFHYEPTAAAGKAHTSRPSTAGSGASRKPSLSSISGGPRSTLNRDTSEIPDLPTGYTFSRRSQTAEIVHDAMAFGPTQHDPVIEALGPENRSRSYPWEKHDRQGDEEPRKDTRRPSAPALHVTRPSVAAAIRPLHEIGSVSSFKPSRSVRGRAQSPATVNPMEPLSETFDRMDSRSDGRNETASRVSNQAASQGSKMKHTHHTPSGSVSSIDSFGSGVRSGSSSSSPPLSASPHRQKKTSHEMNRNGSLMRDFQFGITKPPNLKEAPRDLPFSKIDIGSPETSVPIETGVLSPGLRIDPAVHSGRASPATPDDHLAPSFPLGSGNLLLSPAPLAPPRTTSPQRKGTKPNKGKCRGCGELIIGKSVSSADGRLTGRYHKRCFVCLTCKEPFRTADFYILDNHPYCEQHYHQLNDSVCKACDQGIEGQYLETELKQKFHPTCFKCQVRRVGAGHIVRVGGSCANIQKECQVILRNDYFEVNGTTYCERHASKAAQQPSPLGNGRRHPEKRTTRLMMMM